MDQTAGKKTRLWLLRGQPTAPGWPRLQADHMAKKTNVLSLDRDKWALVKADEAPEGYDGLTTSDPPDGVYLDNYGRPVFVSGNIEVHSGRKVLERLGEEALQLLEKIGDPVLVLERLGRAF
ncbi:MAG: hypothetical protein JRI55_38990 [Deltaproteobacteria bacterium]|jgi:hypothetical protein|nr:hypothetical protein [Deltaproteobacteria bacterium]